MAVTISNAYVQTYEQNVRHLAQQENNKLEGFVHVKHESSEKHNWERLGTGTATEKTTVLQDTPVAELGWSRRVSLAETWNWGEAIEQEDPVQMIVDPNSAVARAGAMAMRRAKDDIIIAAATGNALDGAAANQAFPAAQEVGGAYANEISFDLVTEVQNKFMENDIMPDVPKVFVVGEKQVTKLMRTAEHQNKDYVKSGLDELSATGIVHNWLGFTWIVSTRLLAPAANQLDCLAFTRDAIGLNINRDISCKIAEDPSKSFVWRIYCYMTMGAVRVEDEQIVRVKVADTLT